MALTNEQVRAAQFLESVYTVASTTGNTENLPLWIDPGTSNPKYIYLRDSILNGATYKTHLTGNLVDAQRRYYKNQADALMPIVEATARLWALSALNTQEVKLGRLLLFVNMRPKDLSFAAATVRKYARETTLPVMTAAQTKDITGQSGGSGTMPTRLRRVQYMNAVRAQLALARDTKNYKKDDDPYAYLQQLMAHPRGVRIVDAFAESAEGGRSYASDTIDECRTAIRGLRVSLGDDQDLVWRFPPAISGGVAMLVLTKSPAITRFSLAWATTKKGKLEATLDMAGNAIFVLDLVGGPQLKAVGAILNFVLAAIGTAVSFLHDVEQDQAATATAFAGNVEKLSEGSHSIGTILQGAATIVAAVSVPGALSTITSRGASTGAKAVAEVERAPSVREAPDPRAVSATAVEKNAVKDSERTLEKDAIKTEERALENKAIAKQEETQPSPLEQRGLGIAESAAEKRGTAAVSDTTAAARGTKVPATRNTEYISAAEIGRLDKARADETVRKVYTRIQEWKDSKTEIDKEIKLLRNRMTEASAGGRIDEAAALEAQIKQLYGERVGENPFLFQLQKALDARKAAGSNHYFKLTADASRGKAYKDVATVKIDQIFTRKNKAFTLQIDDQLTVDHIYPRSRIFLTPGFEKLSPEQQIALFNFKDNLQCTSGKFNSFRGDRSFRSLTREEWSTFVKNSSDLAEMAEVEKRITELIKLEDRMEVTIDNLVTNPHLIQIPAE